MRSTLLIPSMLAAVAALSVVTPAVAVGGHAPSAGEVRHSSTGEPSSADVSDTLRALAVLRTYGYTWTSDAGADRAIRHWQRVNGLVVDGIVGPQTLASLGLGNAGASETTRPVSPQPAARKRPAPASPSSVPAAPISVEQVIRDVWPDDLEEHALAIARRESNLQPSARNSCCYGLFQIHFRANAPTLAAMGITGPARLLDATTNAQAALAIYQRSGWSPWACHGACRDIP